jgi:probable phosphoglycerate mutase
MKTTRFCLVRHGETDWNVARRLQGHTDIPLNSHGLSQATQLAQSLEKSQLQFDVLYTSDLQRAAHTANAIVEIFQTVAIPNSALRERHLGSLQGLTLDEASVAEPELWQAHLARELDHELSGGESISQFASRITDVMEKLRHEHAGKTILLVSHGGVLDMMYRITTNQALDADRIVVVPNASLNWISHDGISWRLDRWADTGHLDGISLDNLDL